MNYRMLTEYHDVESETVASGPLPWEERDWWPLCATCNKVVDKLEIVPLPANSVSRAIRDYLVTCHGESETHMLGIWAAYEIVSRRKRLPDAFQRSNEKSHPTYTI